MKILILGKNGQVGWELQRALQPLGEVLALDRHLDLQSNLCGDITNFEEITRTIRKFKPDIVCNAAAYTHVDQAESEPLHADLINHIAVEHLSTHCQLNQALLINYSTDYVFNGQGDIAWTEEDETQPINTYGKSKRLGEMALEHSGVKFINFRTSWVYGVHGNNFLKTILRLAKQKDELNIIDDQIGAPTSAALIADVTAHVIRYYQLNQNKQHQLHGHYHLATQGETSWFDYANFIFQTARAKGHMLKLQQVNPIPTQNYPTLAQRPLNSRLNSQKLQQTFRLYLPLWKQGVEDVIQRIL